MKKFIINDLNKNDFDGFRQDNTHLYLNPKTAGEFLEVITDCAFDFAYYVLKMHKNDALNFSNEQYQKHAERLGYNL